MNDMNWITWLPYADYMKSAAVLDSSRLNIQIRDVINVLNTLHEIENALLLPEEPVVKMWRGYEPQLCWYGMRVCEQIEYRGIFEVEPSKKEIGRASCRERVCKHV